MPLQLSRTTATLSGIITVEDSEPLTAWLRATRNPKANLKTCTHLHTAALQALLTARTQVTVPPVDRTLSLLLTPVFERTSLAENNSANPQ